MGVGGVESGRESCPAYDCFVAVCFYGDAFRAIYKHVGTFVIADGPGSYGGVIIGYR